MSPSTSPVFNTVIGLTQAETLSDTSFIPPISTEITNSKLADALITVLREVNRVLCSHFVDPAIDIVEFPNWRDFCPRGCMLTITRHSARIRADYCDEEGSQNLQFRPDAALRQWGEALDAEGWPLKEGDLNMLLEAVRRIAL